MAVVVLSVAAAGCGGSSDDDRITADDLNPPPRRQATTATSPATAPTDDWRKITVDPSLPRQDIDVNVRYPATFTKAQIAVVQAWANYHHVFLALTDPPTGDRTLEAKFATAEVIAADRAQIEKMRSSGQRSDIPADALLRARVIDVRVSGSTASLLACQVDDVSVLGAGDELVDDDVVTDRRRVYLTSKGGSWRVSPPRPETLNHWAGDEERTCLRTR